MNQIGGTVAKCRCGLTPAGTVRRLVSWLPWPMEYLVACRACGFGFKRLGRSAVEAAWNAFQGKLYSRYTQAQFFAVRRDIDKKLERKVGIIK